MTVKQIAGKQIAFDEEGFMTDPNAWDKDIAGVLAKEVGLDELTEAHWKVIEFTRADFQTQGEAPGLRRITKVGGVPTKQLYELFPKGPAKKIARIAGLKKPTGCI